MTDLIVVSLERWDEVWRRNQHLVDGLLRRDPDLRVLFAEPAADPLHDLASRRRPARGHGPTPVGDSGRLWSFRPVKTLPRRVDSRADERLIAAIARAAARLGFSAPIVWVNDPALAGIMDATGRPTLYDITDDWLAADRPPAELERLRSGETTLLQRAAEVVACSPELVHRKAALRGEGRHPIVLIRNAVDAAAYETMRPRPGDLPAGATAVYAGTIHADRFDVGLALYTARALGPAATLVLVGPNLLPAGQTSALARVGAVVLGPRPPDELIGYLQHADVLVVPHVVDRFTDSLDPIKLYEYAAAGRPVVSTPVAGFRDSDDPRVVIADRAAFPAAVAAAASGDQPGPTGARAIAGWDERVAAMAEVLAHLVGA